MPALAGLCLIWSHGEIDFPQKLINFSYSPELVLKKKKKDCILAGILFFPPSFFFFLKRIIA